MLQAICLIGEMLQVTKPEYTKIKTPIGTKIKLKYNKNNPGDVKYVKDKINLFPIFLHLFILIIKYFPYKYYGNND